jgi:hypothetical protein
MKASAKPPIKRLMNFPSYILHIFIHMPKTLASPKTNIIKLKLALFIMLNDYLLSIRPEADSMKQKNFVAHLLLESEQTGL